MVKIMIKLVCVLVLICLLPYPVTAEGFTVTSISASNYISNNETLQKANVTISLILDDGGQSISGLINPSDFELSNVKVQQPVKIEISKITETLNYAILNQGAIWKYISIYHDAPGFWEGAKCDPAPSFCYQIDNGRIGIGVDRYLVVTRIPAGSYGALQNPNLAWIGTIAVTINGTQYKQNIGSGEAARGAIQFNNIPMNVQWVGSLVTGQATPNPNLYTPSHRLDASRWNTAPRTFYEVYLKSLTELDTSLNLLAGQDKQNIGASWDKLVCTDILCSSVINLLTIHNANVEALLSQNVKIDYSSVTAKSSSAGYDGHIYDVIDRKISNPMLVIRMKATLLNIILSVGKPKIDKIECPDFATGDNDGYARVFVQNVGDATGTFTARTNKSFESPRITLQPQEKGILTLFLQDVNSSIGNIEVYDINSGESDSRDFQLNVTQAKTFIPNTTRTYNELVTKSTPDGMNEVKILDFSGDTNGDGQKEEPCILSWQNGEYQCTDIQDAKIVPLVQETQPLKSFIIEPPAPKEDSFEYMWVIVLILGLILIMLLMNAFGNSRPRSKKGYAPVLIIFVLGLLACVILYVQYWGTVQGIVNDFMLKYAIENIIK